MEQRKICGKTSTQMGCLAQTKVENSYIRVLWPLFNISQSFLSADTGKQCFKCGKWKESGGKYVPQKVGIEFMAAPFALIYSFVRLVIAHSIHEYVHCSQWRKGKRTCSKTFFRDVKNENEWMNEGKHIMFGKYDDGKLFNAYFNTLLFV